MRKHARVDSNHSAVVDALRKIGCSVQSLASVGDGCPDLLVGYHGDNFLGEVKPGDAKDARQRELNELEKQWHDDWRGNVAVWRSPQEAINYVLASGR